MCVLRLKLVSGCSFWLALSLLSGELQPSSESALVLEDDAGICGFALAFINAEEAAAKSQVI